MSEIIEKGKLAKEVSYKMIGLSKEDKNEALARIADRLIVDQVEILEANQMDLNHGKKSGLSESVLDRIMLNEKRLIDMAGAIRQLIELEDPIGETLEIIEKENGLLIKKKLVPIGVIGMIYEARPNVTVDAATLSLKTGNAVILRGSSSAFYSNKAIVKTIHRALEKTNVPKNSVQLIEDTSREAAKELFHLNKYLDVLIPRGGKNLIETVVKESTVPVLETGAGNCHVYIDDTALPDMAVKVIINAKTQRPSVCNTIESILIHQEWFKNHGKMLISALQDKGVQIYGDEVVCESIQNILSASEEDWYTEYLSLAVSMKVLKNVDEAISHINLYGTKHSEAILTENKENAAKFLTFVDAAAVYHNASTRFTDGFEFGYGAEIGISTQKLHARGPMGLKALTSSKYYIYGQGQIRE